MKILQTLLTAFILFGVVTVTHASGESDIKIIKSNVVIELKAAAESGTNTVLVITDEKAESLDQAIGLAEATAALGKNTMVAVVDKSDDANRTIVERYNMNRFPVPFVLILAPAGNVTGGAMPAQITAEKLSGYLPSPCYNQALKARNEHKPTLVFVTAKDDENLGDWESTIAATEGQIDPKPEIIKADVNDAGEASFLSRVGYRGEPTPMLIVVNASGQVTGKFTSNPDAGTVKLAAEKVIAKGCGGCPSSSSCSGKEKTGCEEK